MFDSHCHLNFKAFADDAAAVAKSLAEQQVAALVVGTDSDTSQQALTLAQTFPRLWAAVGLHPIHALDSPWQASFMKSLALEKRVVAIGEVGLDFYRGQPESRATQYQVFDAAISLAKAVDKPLVIHSRAAYDEIIAVLRHAFPGAVEPNKLRGTVHCFMGDWPQAEALLELGFMIGFTGVVTYADIAPALLEVVRQVPLDRLLIETDAPYLTPEPQRSAGKKATGKIPRNSPLYCLEVAKKIATLRALETAQVIEVSEHNAHQLFRIEKDD